MQSGVINTWYHKAKNDKIMTSPQYAAAKKRFTNWKRDSLKVQDEKKKEEFWDKFKKKYSYKHAKH